MISLEQKVKFVLYGFGVFFAMWVIAVLVGVADKEDLSSFIVISAQGLWTSALLLFDVKRDNGASDRKTDVPDKQVLP